MAAPRLKPEPRPSNDLGGPPRDDRPVDLDDRRRQEMPAMPGVVVHRRDPNEPAEPFVPTAYVVPGSMTVEDLLRLMGRREDDDFLIRVTGSR